jgi:pimeloyl-ACP methyl ester carboxylesterase
MTYDQIIAVIGALLAGPDGSAFQTLNAGGHDPSYPVVIEACPRPLPPLDIEGQTVICGRVNVPENHSNPDGNRLDLAFAVLRARSTAPAPDAMIYLHGGPGGRAVPDVEFNATIFDAFRERRDLVLFDQRASGISARTVTCFQTQADELAITLAGQSPAQQAAAAESEADTSDFRPCLAEIAATGVNIADYSTTQNAQDVRAIMYALGYPEYVAYGVSYGTLLGQELMRVAPEGLRAVVLDSIVPVDSRSYDTNGTPLDQAIAAVVDQCAADAACAAAFPDLERTINFVGERLERQPIPGTGSEPAIGLPELVALFENRNSMANPPNVTSFIPQIMSEFAVGEAGTYRAVMAGASHPVLTPESLVTPYVGSRNNDQIAIAYAAANAAKALGLQQTAIEVLLRQLSSQSAKPDGLSDLEALLDAELSSALPGMSVDRLVAMGRDYAALLGGPRDRAAIESWVGLYVNEPYLTRARALLSVMSEADVAAFYRRAETDTGKFLAAATGALDLAIYACQESFPLNSREGFEAELAKLRFPFIAASTRAGTEGLYDLCESFDPVDHPGFHEWFTTDVPVLALAGLNDTQTNGDAAARLETMLGAKAVTFPEAGHGVLLFSRCAVDIALGFLERPDAALNTACVDALRPEFAVLQ